MKQWRWTLNDDRRVPHLQESGQRTDLRDAMIDVANTVEHLYSLEIKNNEHRALRPTISRT